MGKRNHNSLQYDLMGQQTLNSIQNVQTQKQYKRELKKFATFCRSELHINSLTKLESYGFKKAIQGYSSLLEREGYSAATIHTRVAAPCKTLSVDMRDIEKPTRKAIDITRSRILSKNSQGKNDLSNPKYERLVTFQSVVGIRREELKNLRGNNLVYDESGKLCVEVKRGKGGKYQLQRISEKDVWIVEKYFDGTEQKVFKSEELNNKIDLHKIRGENAQAKYLEYQRQCATVEGRNQLTKELINRYITFRGQRANESREEYEKRVLDFSRETVGIYHLRGDTRKLAIANGKSTSYDRLPLMAVSVFHLSHWRLNVAISHYMLRTDI